MNIKNLFSGIKFPLKAPNDNKRPTMPENAGLQQRIAQLTTVLNASIGSGNKTRLDNMVLLARAAVGSRSKEKLHAHTDLALLSEVAQDRGATAYNLHFEIGPDRTIVSPTLAALSRYYIQDASSSLGDLKELSCAITDEARAVAQAQGLLNECVGTQIDLVKGRPSKTQTRYVLEASTP